MTFPVPSFAALAAGNQNLSLLDQQFAAVSTGMQIPCTAVGNNAIQLSPSANAPLISSYTDFAPVFSWRQPSTSTAPVTISVSGLPALTAYTHNGATICGASDLIGGCSYRAFSVSTLDGMGGFVIDVIPATAVAATSTLEYVIDGAGSTITTGLKGWIEVPYACTITRATLLADQTGSIIVDIYRCTYAAYAPPTHPVSADKITGGTAPTISSATKSQDATLTGWTTTLSAGDIIAFSVFSVSTVQRVTLSLLVTR